MAALRVLDVGDFEVPAGELVAVDVEGTVTSGAGGVALGRFLARHGRGGRYCWFSFSRVVPGVLLGRLRIRDRQRLREGWVSEVAQLFAGMSETDLALMGEWVVDQALWPKRRRRVVEEIQLHRAAGRRVALLSGNYQVVVDALARRLGVEGYGTGLEIEHGIAAGRAAEVNAGAAKTTRLREILRGDTLAAAYGDTLADLTMLELATEPVAVHPDRALQRVAVARGWRVLAR